MEPTINDNPSARVIAALIIGLIVGFLPARSGKARRTGGTLSGYPAASGTDRVKIGNLRGSKQPCQSHYWSRVWNGHLKERTYR